MNKIVRERYAVEKLPADLREGFATHAAVKVTVEPIDDAAPGGRFSELRSLRQPRFASMADIDEHVSALRSEWDHRDR